MESGVGFSQLWLKHFLQLLQKLMDILLGFFPKPWNMKEGTQRLKLHYFHSKYITYIHTTVIFNICLSFLDCHAVPKTCLSKRTHIDLKWKIQTGEPMGRKLETFFWKECIKKAKLEVVH